MYALLMSGKMILFTCTAGGNAVKLMSDCLLRAQTAIKQHKMCIYDKNHSKPHHSEKTKQKKNVKCTAF